MPRTLALLLLTLTPFFASCDRLWLDTYWRSERYIAIAVDTPGQMSLSFDHNNGTFTSLVGPTIFSIGADAKYIVLMQHPATDAFGHFDRSITNYFIIERTTSPNFDDRQKLVTGPLTKSDFDKRTITLSLPPFTKTFPDLK